MSTNSGSCPLADWRGRKTKKKKIVKVCQFLMSFKTDGSSQNF